MNPKVRRAVIIAALCVFVITVFLIFLNTAGVPITNIRYVFSQKPELPNRDLGEKKITADRESVVMTRGYDALEDDLKEVYETVGEYINKTGSEMFWINCSHEDFIRVHRAYLTDHPEVFWLTTDGAGYRYGEYDGGVSIEYRFSFDGDYLDEMKEELSKRVEKIMSFDDDGYGHVYVAYEDPNWLTSCEALYTEWYQHYCKVYNNTPLKDIEPNKSISLPLNSDLRDLVVMYMVSQNYDSLLPRDYVEELDRLNGGNPLRIVEVPDGYHCHISSDDEYDHEYVQEFSRIWGADDDSESFTEQQIKRFSRIYEEGFRIKTLDQFGVGEYMDLLIAIKDDRAVVYSKLSKHFAFLKKNKYYTATNDHPKEWFEIIGNMNQKYQTTPMFFTVESVNEYYDLVGKMMASISTRQVIEDSNASDNTK